MLPVSSSNTRINIIKTNHMKRKRVVLSIETKLQIVERLLSGETFSKLGSEYGIGTQTVRDILHNKDKLIDFAFSSGTIGSSLKRKSLKKSSFQDIDKAVFEWFQQQRSEGIPISGPMLIEKALGFHKEMKISEPFLASSGWLAKFKTRYNIHQPKTKDDKLVSEELAPDRFKNEFKSIVQQHGFTVDQIYMIDETVLYWKELPKDLSSSDSEVINNNVPVVDDCITVMMCANANGCRKLKLFTVGKIDKKLPSNFSDTSIVDYYYQSDENYEVILREWFFNRFIPSVQNDLRAKSLPEKTILILNDNLHFQKKINLQSQDGQFFTLTLPKNISQLLQIGQNMDIVKSYYQRKPFFTTEESTNCLESWSFDEALKLLSDVWNDLPRERMQHSSWWWRNLFSEMENEGIIERSHGITTHFMVSQNKIKTEACQQFNNFKACYSNYSCEEQQNFKQRINQGLDFTLGSNTHNKVVSLSEAISCTATLLTFLEQQDDCYNDLLAVRNINVKLKEKLSSFYISRYGSIVEDDEVHI